MGYLKDAKVILLMSVNKIIIYFFLSILLVLSVYPLISDTTIQITNDGDLNEINTWEIGFYNANSTSKWTYNNGSVILEVIDKIDDELLGWGFLHQGIQPHGWGKYAPFEPPLKNYMTIDVKDDFKLILRIGLERSEIEFLNGSIPGWLKNEGYKAHVQIGLALFFEVEGKNYSAPTSEYDTNFQFEITLLRCRLTGDNGVVYLGDQLRFRTPEYDNDTHNVFSVEQIRSGVHVDYEIDLTQYLKESWKLCKGLFPKSSDKIRLKWINFYVEILNAKISVKVDYIDLICEEELYSNDFKSKFLP